MLRQLHLFTLQSIMAYSAPPVRATFHGFLFDMDGTIIDSTSAVEKHWHT